MSKTIENAFNQVFEPTPALFSRRVASTLRNLPPRRAPLQWRRLALAAVVPALAAVGIALGFGSQVFTDLVTPNVGTATVPVSAAVAPTAAATADATAILQDGTAVNIALFGLDNLGPEPNDSDRSDAILMLSVDTQRKTVKLASFERDMLVKTDNGEQRLNVAMQAGPQSATRVLSDNFDIPVDRYAVVNFKDFAGIVDTLGGIDIDVQPAEVAEMNKIIGQLTGLAIGADAGSIAAGQQHLNGRQTLAYLRMRHSSSQDVFGRTERQRAVMKKLFEKLSGLSLEKALGLADTLRQYVSTNLSAADLLALAKALYAARDARVQELRVPTEGAYRVEKTALRVDFEMTRQVIKEFMDSPPPPAPIIVVPHVARPLSAVMPADAQAVVSVESPVNNTASGRLENLRLACNALDGAVIGPGETMSFNALVGETTAEKGYQPAPGADENGIVSHAIVGAGISQVATAIYDAAACADMQIVERHIGLLPAAYARSGPEAVVDYGRGIDLAFRNTQGAPVQVSLALTKSEDGKWTVTCRLLTTARLNYTVKLEATRESIPAPKPDTVTYYAIEAVPKGDSWMIPYHNGGIARTYKVITTAYGSQRRELFTTDTYPARGTIVCYNPADPKPTALPTSNP